MTEKILLLYSALRDARTPWYAKGLAILVLAYIVSPIDIIPDFIPVIGLLDEAILIPVALYIIYKLIPESVKNEQSLNQLDDESKKKLMVLGVILVVIIWALLLILFISFDLFNTIISFFT